MEYNKDVRLEDMMVIYIRRALIYHNYHIVRTANSLGIGRASLYRYIAKYKIDIGVRKGRKHRGKYCKLCKGCCDLEICGLEQA
jgi:hypothetical protein